MTLVDGEAHVDSDRALSRFADALEVDDASLTIVREVAEGHLLLARLDVIRRVRPMLARGHALRLSSGLRAQRRLRVLLFVMLQFHLGVKVTPIADAEKGYFDAKDVLRAVERGAACKVDLSDPAQWDFWSVARVPVEELRTRYGIPPLA